MTEPATHSSSTHLTVDAVPSNSSSSCITQTTQSNGVTAMNPVVALNIPAISALPVAMHGLGNMSNVPLAMCAMNSPQRPLQACQTSQSGTSIPSSAVTNNSGIILLNVGAAAPNNIAAALSQIGKHITLLGQLHL